MKLALGDSTLNFKPNQIVCLEHNNTSLYAEVIQVIEPRQMSWVRPLILKVFSDRTDSLIDNANYQEFPEQPNIWDLREGADLVWPTSLFRLALDTEAIPLLAELDCLDNQSKNSNISHQQLRNFISQVWQAYPSYFSKIKNNQGKKSSSVSK